LDSPPGALSGSYPSPTAVSPNHFYSMFTVRFLNQLEQERLIFLELDCVNWSANPYTALRKCWTRRGFCSEISQADTEGSASIIHGRGPLLRMLPRRSLSHVDKFETLNLVRLSQPWAVLPTHGCDIMRCKESAGRDITGERTDGQGAC